MFDKLIKLFGGSFEKVHLKDAVHLCGSGVLVVDDGFPFQITIGGKKLLLYPEVQLFSAKNVSKDWLLIDPDRYFSAISGFKRIKHTEKLIVGRGEPEQVLFFGFSEKVAMRHLVIECREEGLLFKDLATDHGSRIEPIYGVDEQNKVVVKRQVVMQKIREMLGGPLVSLVPDVALALINDVNKILSTEAYRRRNRYGEPGALLEIPDDKSPIILGDIHTNIDNLLKILSENNFFETLLNDKACLIIIGDAPHCELDGLEGEMDSSLLIMDFIFQLKRLLPRNFFYLRGNHDSFSPQIRKAGINQGALWKKKVHDARGVTYFAAMETLYSKLPMVAIGKDFITCHAGPTKSPLSVEQLVNLKESDSSYHDLLWSRVKSARQPAGYVASTVKNFRRGLGYKNDVPLIVGHTPPTADNTLWLDVGGIDNHHVLFNSRAMGVPVFTRIGDKITPLMYHCENLATGLS